MGYARVPIPSYSHIESVALLSEEQHPAALWHGDHFACVFAVRGVDYLVEFVEHNDRTVFGS